MTSKSYRRMIDAVRALVLVAVVLAIALLFSACSAVSRDPIVRAQECLSCGYVFPSRTTCIAAAEPWYDNPSFDPDCW